MTRMTLDQAMQRAVEHHQAGRLHEAELIYRQILAPQPNHPGALHLLGVIAYQARQFDTAIDLIRRAISIQPDYAEAFNNLGNVLRDKGLIDDAIIACREALRLKPQYARAYCTLGNALRDKARFDDAIAAFRQAIALTPNFPEAINNLGNVLKDNAQVDDAIAAYQQAIALNPNLPEAYNNLGSALLDKGRFDDAIASYRHAILLKPDYADAHSNLGNVLKDKGQLHDAILAYRQAIAFNPDLVGAHSNLILALHYHPDDDPRAIAREQQLWHSRHAEPLRKFIPTHSNDRDPDRRLKIGYVSGDFRNHSVGRFLLPLLERHDHHNFEIFCYSNGGRPDEITSRLTVCADHWRDIKNINNDQAADQIKADKIDILVDLAAHTAGNRLLLFASKPAPVQITSVFTTGLSGMDYRLTDIHLDPPGRDDELHSERPLRLPNCFWCFQAVETAPAVNALPALFAGHVTFASFNNFCKINFPLLRLWSDVLAAIPGSRMILQCPAGDHQIQIREIFQAAGISPQRLEFVPRTPTLQQYFQQYHKVDICLDPTPFSGHTTSFDVLWMGVPLVTLAGRSAVGRSGVSILSNLGLTELIARTPGEYISIAAELARNLPKLAQLRAEMRQKMLASPLMDAPNFARDTEAAYRQVWRTWCQSAAAAAQS